MSLFKRIIALLRSLFTSTTQAVLPTPKETLSKPTTPRTIAFVKPKRRVHSVFIHCSASDNPEHDDIDVIRDWHVHGRGWSDVGYHYFIKKDGTLQEGRPLERIPSAQKGHNTGSIAVCVSGLEDFTEAQFDTLEDLCITIQNYYIERIRFRGHCEVSNKACPVFDYQQVLGLENDGYLIGV